MPNIPLNKVTFTNIAPEDAEWTAHINLLNKWTDPERYLREIIQYARSGKHYPADMHVDLINQVIDATVREAEQRGAAFAIMVTDELHFASHSDDDHIFKNIKNTVRGRFEAATGTDPTPTYPVRVKLQSQPITKEDSNENI